MRSHALAFAHRAQAKEKGLCPDQLELQTLPAVFNRAGYATMRTCKLGNSYEAANRQFTVRRDAKKNGDTDETGSAWHADQVLEYLSEREQASEKKPFFIHFGFTILMILEMEKQSSWPSMEP